MIITCNNCNKKFNLDSDLIPDKGRLLLCASCNHKWFFKKEILENTVSAINEDIDNDNISVFDQNNATNNDEFNPSYLSKDVAEVDTEVEFDKKIEIDAKEKFDKNLEANINEDNSVIVKSKKQNNLNVLNIFIVAIISFVAFIIIVDTFKYPIGKIVPNTELILYNLYESIKDFSLFIRNLA